MERRLAASSNPTAVKLSECNRQAALSYTAGAYSERVLHVYSQHQFARYTRPELQWDGLLDNRDTLILPIFPGEMFEEPYIDLLASRLRDCIDQAAA